MFQNRIWVFVFSAIGLSFVAFSYGQECSYLFCKNLSCVKPNVGQCRVYSSTNTVYTPTTHCWHKTGGSNPTFPYAKSPDFGHCRDVKPIAPVFALKGFGSGNDNACAFTCNANQQPMEAICNTTGAILTTLGNIGNRKFCDQADFSD
jgi:hypothetical protein